VGWLAIRQLMFANVLVKSVEHVLAPPQDSPYSQTRSGSV